MTRNALKTALLRGGLGGLLVLIGSFVGRAGAFIGLALGVVIVGLRTGSPTVSRSKPHARCW